MLLSKNWLLRLRNFMRKLSLLLLVHLDDINFTHRFPYSFWNRAYSTVTMFVSDPTEGSTPVGTDWYSIGERGSQYGHFGALYPVQLYNQTGRGFFRCAGEYTPPYNVSATDRRKLQYRELPGKERFL